MRVSEFIAQAYGLVKSMPTKGTFARNAQGDPVNPIDPTACSLCALGAMARVHGEENIYIIDRLPGVSELNTAAGQILSAKVRDKGDNYWAVPDVNDDYPEFLDEMFLKAIANAKAKEGCAV